MTYSELEQKHNLKQVDVAKLFGVPYATVQNWHRGKSPCQQYMIDLMDWALSHGYKKQQKPVARIISKEVTDEGITATLDVTSYGKQFFDKIKKV